MRFSRFWDVTQRWMVIRLDLSGQHMFHLKGSRRSILLDPWRWKRLSWFSTYALQPSRLIVRSGLDVPTFSHQVSPRVSPRKNTQRWKVELWAKNVRKVCLKADIHFTFRDLLHAVKLRHGTDGFTFPPKKGIFRPKNPTASVGCEPANLGTKAQHATSRPPNSLKMEPIGCLETSVK
jgi:hypothetical protein